MRAVNRQINHFLTVFAKRPRTALLILSLLLLFVMLVGFFEAQDIAGTRIEARMDQAYSQSQRQLENLIEATALAPEVLAVSKSIRDLVANPDHGAAQVQSEQLEEAALAAKLDVVYVVDREGNTLAASNWRHPDSFVGHNYRFRPYFQQALAGQTGRYLAKGVTSHKLGAYLARPISVAGTTQGVIVVKIMLDSTQSMVDELWRSEASLVLVADGNGVVIIAPNNGLVFKAMNPIPEALLQEMRSSRQYGDEIVPLAMRVTGAGGMRLRFVQFDELPGRTFVQKAYQLPKLGLQLFIHRPAADYWEVVAEFTGMFALAGVMIVLIGITLYQRLAYGVQLTEAAVRDPLTGLNTRLYMREWCASAILAQQRDVRAGLALVMFDLDHFKRVNDVHGHLAGDDVLRDIGEIIRGAIRGGDLAVRFGGEELAVFVHCADKGEAMALAERIRLDVEQREFVIPGGGPIHITLSAGVAFHEVSEPLDALFARADERLYAAKAQGRNRICD